MSLVKSTVFNLILILIFDMIWINVFAGSFYADQLGPIGRFDSQGGFDVRLAPAIILYLLMSLAIEIYIFRNPAIRNLKSHVLHSAFLGTVVYGVYDLTNRAVLAHYPIKMVVVDIMWGTCLFAAVAWVHFQVKRRVNII